MQRKNGCDVYNELWVKMYIDGVTTFNKDLNIVKKEEGNFVSSESLKFLRKSILVSCEIVLYIFQV